MNIPPKSARNEESENFFLRKDLTGVEKVGIIFVACHGGVAQLARACGSYPQCHRFESSRRYHGSYGATRKAPQKLRPVGQVVKTPPFHGGNMGSSPVRVTIGGLAQLVRAPASHAGGHWFESSSLHHQKSLISREIRDFSCFLEQKVISQFSVFTLTTSNTTVAISP